MLNDILILLIGFLFLIIAISLIIIDSKPRLTNLVVMFFEKKIFRGSSDPFGVSQRLYVAIKSLLFIFCLFIVLGAIIYFTS